MPREKQVKGKHKTIHLIWHQVVGRGKGEGGGRLLYKSYYIGIYQPKGCAF